jgi:hypothetical protein
VYRSGVRTEIDVTEAAGADLATDTVLIAHAEILFDSSC